MLFEIFWSKAVWLFFLLVLRVLQKMIQNDTYLTLWRCFSISSQKINIKSWFGITVNIKIFDHFFISSKGREQLWYYFNDHLRMEHVYSIHAWLSSLTINLCKFKSHSNYSKEHISLCFKTANIKNYIQSQLFEVDFLHLHWVKQKAKLNPRIFNTTFFL